MSAQPTHTQRLAIALLCVGIGVFLLLLASELIPGLQRQASDAPNSIIALAGLVFFIAGCMVFLGAESRANDLLAGLLCLSFGLIGAWVAFLSPSEGFSGGLPFVSRESNVSIARVVFGAGSLVCLAIAAWAFRRFIRAGSRTE